MSLRLDEWTTHALKAALGSASASVLLFPIGSTEAHGPHLPLGTDVFLAVESATRAAAELRARGVFALVGPTLPFSVTDFASGFAGTVSLSAATFIALVNETVGAFLSDGFQHVCLVNHHLDPDHLAALDACRGQLALRFGADAVSCPAVISKRWGPHLGDEFRSGACHAGEYETSLVLATRPETVDKDRAQSLPAVHIRLSEAIRNGCGSFLEAGAVDAYVGRPADATVASGEALYRVLTSMLVTEIQEALA